MGAILNRFTASRAGRALFAISAFLLLATIAFPGPAPRETGAGSTRLTAVAVPLDPADPHHRQVGQLLYLRGWALTAEDPRFGAISAIHVERGRVIALSDAGMIFEFALPAAAGAQRALIRPLPQPTGTPKRSRDTESLVVAGRYAWIGFEGIHAVKRFGLPAWGEQSASRPRAMRRWRSNAGAEAMVRLRDGRFLVFSEGKDDNAAFSPVLLFEGDPARPDTRAVLLRYRRQPGFRVTDAALLPDGRLLILNRRFGWLVGLSASLVVAPLPPLRGGATIAGREIAVLAAPLTISNMEALSVERAGGRTLVRIASDDNFMPVLQTLLLEFAFIEGGAPET